MDVGEVGGVGGGQEHQYLKMRRKGIMFSLFIQWLRKMEE